MNKKAFLTWTLWQDWAYLSKFLLEKWYKVYWMIMWNSDDNFENLKYFWIENKIEYVIWDLINQNSIEKIIKIIKPDEIYNLWAQSFVWISWENSVYTTQVNSLWPLYLLNAIKTYIPNSKFYQASTSEMFWNSTNDWLKNENTPFHPRSPYAISKLYAYRISNNFKESYWMFCCNWILFNHESPIRWINFVTRKISDWVAKIKLWMADKIILWNLNSRRDWWFAWDYVEAMWLMMQHKIPDNYIISTWETHSIEEFLNIAFTHIWIKDYKNYILIDSKFKRPSELFNLYGSNNKAKKNLWWEPKMKFEQLVKFMVDEDIKRYCLTN